MFGTIVGADVWITWLDFSRSSSWPRPWIFKVKYGIWYIYISHPKMVRLPRNETQTHRLNSRTQNVTIGFDFGHNLDLESLRSNMEFAISHQKWSDCHETKSKYIDWTLALKCDYQIWPGPWPWPWIFKGKYGISYFSTKSGPNSTKRKQTYRLTSMPQMWPKGLSLIMTLIFEFSRSNVTLTFDHTHSLGHG